MQEILDAIQAEQFDALAGIPVPDHYRGITVHADEVDMFAGIPSADKDPRKSLHLDDVADARDRPRRGARRGDGQRHQLQHGLDVDLRAAADVRLPAPLRPHLAAHRPPRPALPRRRLRSGGRRAAHRAGRQRVEARRPGGRALPVGRAGEPRRPRRHDDGSRAAHLGLRDELRRPRRAGAGQVQPAHAQARAPDLGGGRGAWPGQLHGVPPARLAQRRGHEAGRHRADLGRLGRPRLLRHAVRAQRRRHARLRRRRRRRRRRSAGRWAPS